SESSCRTTVRDLEQHVRMARLRCRAPAREVLARERGADLGGWVCLGVVSPDGEHPNRPCERRLASLPTEVVEHVLVVSHVPVRLSPAFVSSRARHGTERVSPP